MLKIILFILLGYGVIVLLAGIFQRQLIYQPDKADLDTMKRMAESLGLLPWRNSGGTIIGWKTPDQTEQANTTAVIAFHGNAGHALHRTYVSDGFTNQKSYGPWQVFLFEYPGYGHRTGNPSEETVKKVAKEAFEYLASQNFKQILVFGESLGSGPASYIAGEFPDETKGLVLVSPFTSLRDVAVEHYFLLPAGLILKESYDNTEMLKAYNGPAVFLYAENDFIVPNSFTRELHDSYQGPKIMISQSDRGHNSINYNPKAEWWQRSMNFMMIK